MRKTEGTRYFINSLARGLSILGSFSSSEHGCSLSEVAALNNISHATANRYLFTLRELGYLLQDPLTKKYKLTAKIVSSFLPLLRNMGLRSRLLPYMIGLRKDFDVAIQCAIPNDTEIVFLERIRSGSLVELDFTTGSRAPVYCTALGKALLAFMDKVDALKIINKIEFAPQTPNTITKKGHFIKELEVTKQRGCACTLPKVS
jgi:IclR family pca regulon transcriptional regulator